MTSRMTEQPRAVLVDDDIHSARLLVRTLGRLGGPTLTWYGRAERSLRLLAADFAGPGSRRPQTVIVDLKGSSTATATFIRQLRERLPAAIPIVAIAADREAPVHDAILAAGATAVFVRGTDAAAYRSEVARLAAFLAPRLFRSPHRAIIPEAAAPTPVGLDIGREGGTSDDGDAAPRKFRARTDAGTEPRSAAGTASFTLSGRRADHHGHAGEPEAFFV